MRCIPLGHNTTVSVSVPFSGAVFLKITRVYAMVSVPKSDFLNVRRNYMKRAVLLLTLFVAALVSVSCTKSDYKKVVTDFITANSQIRDFEVREVADTKSAAWKAVIVYTKQGAAKVPMLFFVSTDGKSIVANSMVFVNNKPIFERQLQPELGKIDFNPAVQDRIIINASGKTVAYMYTDPDCPYCIKVREKLKTYSGEYQVILKHFPLEQIHPGATKKAIAEQADWLKKTRKDLTKESDIFSLAQKIVEEDMAEARKANIEGVPTYIMADGTLKQGLF
jgi:protein-disulfide isomerase